MDYPLQKEEKSDSSLSKKCIFKKEETFTEGKEILRKEVASNLVRVNRALLFTGKPRHSSRILCSWRKKKGKGDMSDAEKTFNNVTKGGTFTINLIW